jgi:hypothetical protein
VKQKQAEANLTIVKEQCHTFLASVLSFIDASAIEQDQYLSPTALPSVSAYIAMRSHTSAVRPCLALIELCQFTTLPAHVIADSAMQRIWDAVNTLISYTNDVMSLKKEMRAGQVENLVPLLYVACGGSLERAMNEVKGLIEGAARDVDAAEKELVEKFAGEEEQVREGIRKVVDGCKFACTANLSWR